MIDRMEIYQTLFSGMYFTYIMYSHIMQYSNFQALRRCVFMDYGYVIGNKANIRLLPGTNNQVVTQVDYGFLLKVFDLQNNWCSVEEVFEKLDAETIKGWISKKYIKILKKESRYYGYIANAKRVDTWSGPGEDFELWPYVHYNDFLRILGSVGDWYAFYKENDRSVAGWVKKEFVIISADGGED